MTAAPNTQSRISSALFYGIVLVLAYLVFRIFEPFLAPIAWAVVLVVVSFPVYTRLSRRMRPAIAAVVMTFGITLILIVPTLLVMGAFVRQGVVAVREIQQGIASGHYAWVNDLWARIQARFPDANPGDLGTVVSRYGEKAAAYVAERLGAILRNTAEFLFHLCVAILAMFYLYIDGDKIVVRLRELLPFEESHRTRMISEARDLIFASVTSSLVSAAAHGVLGGLAFELTGISAPVFWGVMMGFMSFVPLVGSAIIWVPAAISLMVGGHLGTGIFLAAICAGIVGLMDNLIRPWLISGRAEMGGLVIFISVLGGISVFGLLGVVLGPIVVATAASLLDLYVPSAPSRNAGGKASGKKAGAVLE
ncbi:MAG: AI-2E family transporter [Candidatus Acidiferrales bacterium]